MDEVQTRVAAHLLLLVLLFLLQLFDPRSCLDDVFVLRCMASCCSKVCQGLLVLFSLLESRSSSEQSLDFRCIDLHGFVTVVLGDLPVLHLVSAHRDVVVE